MPRRAGGLGTHNLSSPRRKIADTAPQEHSRREDAAQQGGVCEECPRHASGSRGRRNLHSYAPSVMNAWHAPAGAAPIPTRPLATIQPRAERTPRSFLKYARRLLSEKTTGQRSKRQPVDWSDHSAQHTRSDVSDTRSATCRRHRDASSYSCSSPSYLAGAALGDGETSLRTSTTLLPAASTIAASRIPIHRSASSSLLARRS